MKKILISWIGMTDLKASKGVDGVGIGPIAQAVTNCHFDKVVLISNYSEVENKNGSDTNVMLEIKKKEKQFPDYNRR